MSYIEAEQTAEVVRVGIFSIPTKTRLVDRYSDERFFAQRAEDDPQRIFFFPTDPRWEHVWAYVGVPHGYIYNIDEDPEWRKKWENFTEFLIEVRYDGTVWYAKQVVHNLDLAETDFDLYSFLLNEMCERIDEYMEGRPNDD